MSGIDEILPWALENFPVNQYEDFNEWYEAIDFDFQENGRMELDKILKDEKELMRDAFDENKITPMTPIETQEFIDADREDLDIPRTPEIEEPEEEEPDLIENTIKSAKRLFNKIRSFFS